MGIYFIDESGYYSNYVFVAVKVNNLKTPDILIKDWRKWRKNHPKIKYEINEYHDTKVTEQERKKFLNLISKSKDIKIWGLQKNNYNSSLDAHIQLVTELLWHVRSFREDNIIIDDPGFKKTQKEKYIRKLKKNIGINQVTIGFEVSEKEKGIQIADAVAGSLSRDVAPRPGKKSHFKLISEKLAGEIKKI